MNNQHIHIINRGDKNIYASCQTVKARSNSELLKKSLYRDYRGYIERKNVDGISFNIIETKKGCMRSGDIHKTTQFDMVLSGEIEVWALMKSITEKNIIKANTLLIIEPHAPHLFIFLENTLMIEWWDGPFAAWYYKPYRDIINKHTKGRK
jgi:hypothetical protein